MTNWKRFNGNDIGDLAETILSDITTSDTDDLEFYIGGDSQSSMNKVKFTVAIIKCYTTTVHYDTTTKVIYGNI